MEQEIMVPYGVFEENNEILNRSYDILTNIIDAFNVLRRELNAQIGDDVAMDGASTLSFVTESPEFKTLWELVNEAEDFLMNGPFDGCEEGNTND